MAENNQGGANPAADQEAPNPAAAQAAEEAATINLIPASKLPSLPKFVRSENFYKQKVHFDNYFDDLELQFSFLNIRSSERKYSATLIVGGTLFQQLAKTSPPVYPEGVTEASPQAEKDAVKYETLKNTLRKALQPKQSKFIFRNQFQERKQSPNETVSVYVSQLYNLARYCEFGENLEERVAERLLCGLHSTVIKQRCFEENTGTVQEILKTAISLESAISQTAKHPTTQTSNNVGYQANSVRGGGRGGRFNNRRGGANRGRGNGRSSNSGQGSSQNNDLCYRCGKRFTADQLQQHRQQCYERLKDIVCRACQSKGHLASICQKKKSVNSTTIQPDAPPTSTPNSTVNAVTVDFGLSAI